MDIRRIVLNPIEFSQAGLDLIKEEIYHVGGANSIYVPKGKKKFILSTSARKWADINGEIVWMTPGEAARTELRREFPDLSRVGWKRGHIKQFDWRPPIYFDKPQDGGMTYLDLRAAYWQVYRNLWLNTPFPGGYGTLSLRPVADRLEDWKPARNAVIGVCRSRVTQGIRGSKRVQLRVQNPFLSPGLWATVMACLHSIAESAIDRGCVYINTDCYIFPGQRVAYEFREWLSSCGLVATEIGGYCDLRGWNSYQIGRKETGLYKLGLEGGQKGIDNVKRQNGTDWLAYLEKCRLITRRGGINRKTNLRKDQPRD